MEPSHRLAKPAADPLTSLLGHLLDDILTLLDVRDAVRTSALSRAWRRRWESLPALSLSFLDRPGTAPEVVDSVLVRYAGRISRFSFHLDARSARRIDDWLLAFSRRGVESICLRSSLGSIHSCIFSCVHLVFLELHNSKMPPLHEGFAGFSVLKEIKFVRVVLPTNGGSQLGAIIGGLPLLGVLKLHRVVVETPGEEACVIAGPNLHSFEIISLYEDDYDWEFRELPCLEDATINLESYAYAFDFEEFLAGVAQVRKLTIYTCYKPFLGGNLLDTLEYNFVNLKSLFLHAHFRETHAILSTLCLIRSSPNLEELEIEVEYDPLSSIEKYRAIMEDFFDIWQETVAKESLPGHFIHVESNFSKYGLSNQHSFQHTAVQYATCLQQLMAAVRG